MTIEIIYNAYPEGAIFEQFAYSPKLSAYPNILDMKELGVIAKTR